MIVLNMEKPKRCEKGVCPFFGKTCLADDMDHDPAEAMKRLWELHIGLHFPVWCPIVGVVERYTRDDGKVVYM